MILTSRDIIDRHVTKYNRENTTFIYLVISFINSDKISSGALLKI